MLFRPLLGARFTQHMNTHPKFICANAANAISVAFERHMQVFQGFGVCALQVQCLLTASTIHIVDLSNRQALASLTQACWHFRALALRVPWAAGSLQIIRGLMKKWYTDVPPMLEEVLEGSGRGSPAFDFRTTHEINSHRTRVEAQEHGPENPLLFAPFPSQQLPLFRSMDYGTDGVHANNGKDAVLDDFERIIFPSDSWSEQFIAPF